MDLFEFSDSQDTTSLPLAEKMRPRSFQDIIGQDHLLRENSVFRSQLRSKNLKSLILWGPSGTGKTTFARSLAKIEGFRFVPLSATDIGAKALRTECEEAIQRRRMSREKTILFVDEIHRLNRAEQDVLLPYVEKADVVLVGATTESVSHSINRALLSRTQVLRFEKLSNESLALIAERALAQMKLTREALFSEDGWEFVLRSSGGDARRLLQILESVTFLRENAAGQLPLSAQKLKDLLPAQIEGYDRRGSDHYDTISIFIKAMRAGQAETATRALARMLKGGEDPMFIARRMVIFASEDVGLADPKALPLATSVLVATEKVGLPECAINLSHVAIYLARCAKSREAYDAWRAAESLEGAPIAPT